MSITMAELMAYQAARNSIPRNDARLYLDRVRAQAQLTKPLGYTTAGFWVDRPALSGMGCGACFGMAGLGCGCNQGGRTPVAGMGCCGMNGLGFRVIPLRARPGLSGLG